MQLPGTHIELPWPRLKLQLKPSLVRGMQLIQVDRSVCSGDLSRILTVASLLVEFVQTRYLLARPLVDLNQFPPLR